ncbi:MAG TPA: phosphatase PAP2 family protein [Polyangia bacterium]|nr:phosphatase PAP2 family protein [Polyangia bacterium]
MAVATPPAPSPETAPTASTSELASPAYKWTIGGALAALQSLVYFGIGHLHLHRSTEILRTRLDDAIPFWPWTAWCYLPFYAGVFIIAVAGIKRKAVFKGAAQAVLVVMTLGALGHVFIGAEYPRPVLYPPFADLSAAFLAAVQHIDPPGNVFPSLHVAHTTMLALILIKDRPRLGGVALAMATALALSTLTTKQHFLADVLSGYALAFFGRWFALRKLPREA